MIRFFSDRSVSWLAMDDTHTLTSLTFAECPLFCPSFRIAKCVRVQDGSIMHLAAVMHGHGVFRHVCRLVGIVTPELRARSKAEKTLAKIARDILKRHVLNSILTVTTHGTDKYGRLLVRISTSVGTDVATLLLTSGVALRNDAERKDEIDWETMLKAWMVKNPPSAHPADA